MNRSTKWMNLLGLANRARKVISGEELVVKEVRHQRAKLVILSDDASPNTEKKIMDKCRSFNVPVARGVTRYELGHAIGKDARVVVTILDGGFARSLQTLLDES
ncbi:YlxQ family RNA-binding protein [Mangrovibacillus cuniculi]|uniref:YlxQ family RNA-binding protein n=1 Tax=Mangrovibacillus cuniculi TaxID=2593652 RepID=A0A7S8HEZ6_9BACI|nr:YlxQ family RNA-binding protein [Mangrovibacillus cuniculi]QPC46384.1 YlxQ family RNA-binding protein [Mangrovibacillus cuniculi]